MLINATRSARAVIAVAAIGAAGCGQDLDFGPLAGGDGLTLPPPNPSASGSGACPIETAADLPPPAKCFPNDDISWTKTHEGTFEYKFTSESCVVTADGQILRGWNQQLPACPVGVYWKFAPTPWRRTGPPLPADGAFPSTADLERSIGVVRADTTADMLPGPHGWRRPFDSEGWQAVPRQVQVWPEQRAVFVRLDPRPSTGQRFVVFVSYEELFPAAVRLNADPVSTIWALDIAPGAPPVIEAQRPARSEPR